MKRIRLATGDEQSVLTPARKYYSFGRGAIAAIKRAYRKRFRQKEKSLTVDTTN